MKGNKEVKSQNKQSLYGSLYHALQSYFVQNFTNLYVWFHSFFEAKIVANWALDPFKNLLYSSPENKFSIAGELTAP